MIGKDTLCGKIMSSIKTQQIELNMGPQHPSTHGVLRLILTLDGERVIACKPDLGFLHRGIEKLAEKRTYLQFIPMTDRLDYVSSMTNNAAYVYALEKLGGIEVPERAEWIRLIVMELQRIASHLVFYGSMALDLGATTPFLYAFREREDILDIFEELCGARMTYNYFRPGGVSRDLPKDFHAKVTAFIKKQREKLKEYDDIFTGNRIFISRTENIGVLSAEDAVNFSLSGPALRASNVDYDVRKAEPYSFYSKLNWKPQLGTAGDTYTRVVLRCREIEESLNMIEQALDMIPEGELKCKLPARLTMPKGEVYHHIEGSRGDVGVFIVSDGSDKPYRLKWRAPSFINLTCLEQMVKGMLVADVIAVLAGIDIILGEVDR